MSFQIFVDTNVIISALRSRRGASFKLLSLVGIHNQFEINVSVPLVLEYEDVAKRPDLGIDLSLKDINAVIDYLCEVGNRRQIFFLWRPFLPDPKDDLVLELAVEAQCDYIISYNKRDFRHIEIFGIQVLDPLEFLKLLGEIT